MSIVVFYLQKELSDCAPHAQVSAPAFAPHCLCFTDKELSLALTECERLRQCEGVSHVTLSSEMSDMVGKVGVSAVVDGKTPDGQVYDWSKAGRAGQVRRNALQAPVLRKDGNTR